MQVDIYRLKEIENINNYHIKVDTSDPAVSSAFTLDESGKVQSTNMVSLDFLNILLERGTKKISIVAHEDIMSKLREQFPDVYPTPLYKASLNKIADELSLFEELNTKSKRKRKVRLLQDVIMQTGHNKFKIVAGYGTEVTPTLLRNIKNSGISLDTEVDYEESENGVLVFVPGAKHIKLRIDIFAVLSNLDMPIFDAETARDAFDFYRDKQPKLVVLGNLATEPESKELYLYLEEYDPFAKILNYDQSPSSKRKEEAKKIMKAYEKDYRKIMQDLESEKERNSTIQKAELGEEQKKAFMAKIRKIQENASVADFADAWFLARHFGKKYEMKGIDILLKKVRKTLPMNQAD